MHSFHLQIGEAQNGEMQNYPIKLESLPFFIGEFSIFSLHFGVLQFADEGTHWENLPHPPKKEKKKAAVVWAAGPLSLFSDLNLPGSDTT